MSAKSNPASHGSTPRQRAARIKAAILEAGNSAPKGVRLVDSREPSPKALAHGRSLEGFARRVLARHGKTPA